MRQVDLTTMMNCAYASKAKLEEEASYNGRPVRLYLHWTACGYWNKFNDYHINIDSMASDLRNAAGLFLYSLRCGGTIYNYKIIERGYEDFYKKIKKLGAKFTRVSKK